MHFEAHHLARVVPAKAGTHAQRLSLFGRVATLS